MVSCNFDVFLNDIDAVNVGAEPCHRFTQKATAAPDIENAQIAQRPRLGKAALEKTSENCLQVKCTQLVES